PDTARSPANARVVRRERPEMGRRRPKMERDMAKSSKNGRLLYNRPEPKFPAGRLQITLAAGSPGSSANPHVKEHRAMGSLSFSARVSAAVVTALVALPASAFAQTAPSAFSTAAQAAVAQVAAQPDTTGPVRPLSIDEAAKLALEQNLGIRIQR